MNEENTEKKHWWSKGIQFECQGSSKCCMSRGEHGYVYLTLKDRQRLSKYLGLSTSIFTNKYCDKTDGIFHLKELERREACIFLAGTACGVYEGRPTQCRTWPFWPENMHPKSWSHNVKKFCPGVGKGPVITKEHIEKTLKKQREADENPS